MLTEWRAVHAAAVLAGWSATPPAAQPPPASLPPAAPAGVVMTVTGPVHPEPLGATLMHEHLASDMLLPEVPTGYRGSGPLPPLFVRRFQETGRYYRVPRPAEEQAVWDRPDLAPVMHERLGRGWLTRSMFVLDDSVAAVAQLEAFRARWGRTATSASGRGSPGARDPARPDPAGPAGPRRERDGLPAHRRGSPQRVLALARVSGTGR